MPKQSNSKIFRKKFCRHGNSVALVGYSLESLYGKPRPVHSTTTAVKFFICQSCLELSGLLSCLELGVKEFVIVAGIGLYILKDSSVRQTDYLMQIGVVFRWKPWLSYDLQQPLFYSLLAHCTVFSHFCFLFVAIFPGLFSNVVNTQN